MESSSDIGILVGDALRARRIEINLTQEELAERAATHDTYVGSVERGEKNVSLARFVRLCEALDVSASDVLAQVGL